jgi:molybdate-binding protein
MEVLGARSDVEVAIMGSEAALERLFAGATDVAGCHFGSTDVRAVEASLARNPGHLAHAVFVREQGLILARNNPLGISAVADLARTRARFVNRQKGSGTRAWFDRMLQDGGVSPSDIVGYSVEEFTHQAVAAVVASGAADAGLGVRAVALSFGLGFIPLGRETYYLLRHADSTSATFDEIVAELRSRAGKASGYSPIERPQPRRGKPRP